jgi:hypothetical protein
MAKVFMKTAKELARKAYLDGMQKATPVKIDESEISERFENWWSDNYGNRDTTKFVNEVNIFVELRRYIKAE